MISLQQVINIHSESIKRHGGMPGVKNKGLLESAIISPQQGYIEDDVEIISTIIYGICQNHPFNDGNKRTAFVVGKYLLNEIGKTLTMTNDEYEKVILDLAGSKLSKDQLTEIIKKNIK